MVISETSGGSLHAPSEFTQLVTTDAGYHLAGIGAALDSKFGISRQLACYGFHRWPDCVMTGSVLVLVAQPGPETPPSLWGIERALEICRCVCEAGDIRRIAMPPIFTKEFRWPDVKKIIKKVFAETDVSFTVYFREKEAK